MSPDQRSAALTTEGGLGCPVCGSPARCAIVLPDFRLFHCAQCDCWSSSALADQAVTSFEPTGYFENADSDRSKWERLLDKIDAPSRRSVLDVGCGTGAFLAHACERMDGGEAFGIELDPGRAAEARERNPSASIHTGDALGALGGIDRQFDLITLWDVFEHVPAPSALLQALATRLAPGGVIYIQTIHENSIAPTLGRWSYRLSGGRLTFPVRRTHEPHHIVFFSLKGLDQAAGLAGLAVREHWFDRLAWQRMDGAGALTTATALLLTLENRLGNGLFVNLLLEARPPSP